VIQNNFQRWLSGTVVLLLIIISSILNRTPGPQTPGLIILEHELNAATVQAFMTAFPLMKQNNWELRSVAQLNGAEPYQNAKDATSPPTLVPLTAGGDGGAGLTSSTSTTSSTPTPDTTTSSAKTRTGGTASALPNNKNKSNAAPTLSLPRSTTFSFSVLLTLLFSRCLI
jgi:chitin deacetylase